MGNSQKNNLTLHPLLDVNPSLNKNSRLNINQEIMLPKRDSSSSQALPHYLYLQLLLLVVRHIR